MILMYKGEVFHDYLNAFSSKEELEVANNIHDIQLKGRIAKDEFIIKDTYSLIFDALENREGLRLGIFQSNDCNDNKSLNTKNLEIIIKNEKINERTIEEIKMIFRECPIDELLNRLKKLLGTKILATKSFNDCLSHIISYGFNNEKRGYEISIKDYNLLIDGYTCLIKVNTLYILMKAELRRKIIDAHINWKLSPEIKKRYIEMYEDLSPALKKEGRYVIRDVNEFCKSVYKTKKYQGLRYGDPIPKFETVDFFHFDNMNKKLGEKIDKDYQNSDEKFILPESTIEKLFNQYGKFWGVSKENWRIRFLNIEEMLPDISTIEPEYKFSNNRHLLITILSIIHEKNKKKKKEEKILNFNEYALNRWGIYSFTKTKSKRFSKKNSSINHPEKENIEKMI